MGLISAIGGFASGVGKWLLKNPVLLAIAMLTAAFVLVVVSKNATISTIAEASAAKDERIEMLVSSLAQARANVSALSTTLGVQSASIDALKVQGDQSLVKFDTLIAGQALANASTTKKLAALDAARPGPDKCASALALVRTSVQ